jgi:hypothetical protein
MLLQKFLGLVAVIVIVASGGIAVADDNNPAAVKSDNGKYMDKEGNPTFKVAQDGTVDWYPLYLSACSRQRRRGQGASGQTRRQACHSTAGGGFLHGQALIDPNRCGAPERRIGYTVHSTRRRQR